MGLYGTYRNADGIGYCVSNCTPNEHNYIISPTVRFLLYWVGNKDRINPGTRVNYENIHIHSASNAQLNLIKEYAHNPPNICAIIYNMHSLYL